MALIAIDPGKVTGFAAFNSANVNKGRLSFATACTEWECLENIAETARRLGAEHCIIEVPQVYPGQQQKGDQNDLIKLAVMVGRYADRAASCGFQVKLVKPREWKGQLPKGVCWQRVRETLTAHELSVMAKLSKSRAHNMHDAIGMGTKFQKRWR